MPNSNNSIHPVDALKSLDQIHIADPRNDHIELVAWHARITEITLVESTPKDVKQLFENAKNIALYAYFAYRLHQAAETIGYSALEKALKMKYEQEKDNIVVQRSPTKLVDYMNIALEQRWIASEGYESARYLAARRVRDRKVYKPIKSGALDSGESIPVPEPGEHEVVGELGAMDFAEKSLHGGRHIRNFLAHGDGGLSPSSVGTLAKIAEEVNQLFKAQAPLPRT